MFAGITLLCSSANAAGPGDCAPVLPLPGYVAADPPERFAYDALDFAISDGGGVRTVTVAGETCGVDYHAPVGAAPPSEAEIHAAYRDQLKAAGATIMVADAGRTLARMPGDDGVWVQLSTRTDRIDVRTVRPRAHRQTMMAPTPWDWPRLGHMQGYEPTKPEQKDFGSHVFSVRDRDRTRNVTAAGAVYAVSFIPTRGARAASDLDIQLNYRGALRALGAELLLTDPDRTTARIDEGGPVTWIDVVVKARAIHLTVVEVIPGGHGRRPG